MKKYLFAIAAALLTLAACNKDFGYDNPSGNNGTTVLKFRSERPQLESETKTMWDGSTIVWTSQDKIKMGFTFDGAWWAQSAAYSSENETPNNHIKFYQADTVTIDPSNPNVGTFTYNASSVTGPKDEDENDIEGDYVFYAFYPSAAIPDNNQDGAPVVKAVLKTTQTPEADSFDASTDIMVAKSETITTEGLPEGAIDLSWTRVVAHGLFTLKNFQNVASGETISKIVLTAQEGANITGNQSVSIEDGSVTARTGNSNEVTLEGTNLAFVTEGGATNLKVWLSVIPATITSLTVDVETNKASYVRVISGISKTLKGNACNKLAIDMSTAVKTAKAEYEWVKKDITAITADDVFVIVGNNGSNYAMANDNGSSAAPDAVAVTISGNKLAADPVDRIQWTLTKSGSNYTFYPNGVTDAWLYVYNNNNGLRVGTNSDKVFTINNGYLYHPGQSRYIGVYTASGASVAQDWRSYKLTNSGAFPGNIADQTFAFYVRSASGSTKPVPTISFGTPTTSVNVGESVTNAATISVSGLSVTYSSSNTSVATVNASTGAVTGVAEGTATITATFAGNTSYDPASASYEISVVNAAGENDGSLAHPYTASEAKDLALDGDTGTYYITGYVSKVVNQFDATHGTANFWISDNADNTQTFEGYHIKYFGNVNWVEGNAFLSVGDQVTINGKLTTYGNNPVVPETSSGYLVSLNGKNKGLTPGSLTVSTNDANKQITVTWGAATGSTSAISYAVTCGTLSYNATAAGSHTFTMPAYGLYTVTVVASASDAISATSTTNATISDPSSSTKDYYKMVTDLSDLTAGTYVIGALRSSSATNNFYFGKATVSSGDWVVSDGSVAVPAVNGVRRFEVANLPSGAVEFTLTGNNTNGFTISNGSNYLYYTSAANRKLAFAAAGSTQKWIFQQVSDALISGGVSIHAVTSSGNYTLSENSTATGAIRGYANTTVYRAIYIFKKVNE